MRKNEIKFSTNTISNDPLDILLWLLAAIHSTKQDTVVVIRGMMKVVFEFGAKLYAIRGTDFSLLPFFVLHARNEATRELDSSHLSRALVRPLSN
jgi:hypothetical protein